MNIELTGWIELDGQKLSLPDLADVLKNRQEDICRFGGEFFLRWGDCCARDHFGVIPGDCPKGTSVCKEGSPRKINPAPPSLSLEESIVEAVRLRSDEGVTALSGGVDSTLVARLADRECVVVGLDGSHDIPQAKRAADALGLDCTPVTIRPEEIEAALPIVIETIPEKDPVNTGIALTQYFLTRMGRRAGLPAHPDRAGGR